MESSTIHTCLIESNPFFREGLKSILRDTRFRIDFEAGSLADARSYLDREKPDLVVAELPPDDDEAMAALIGIREAFPDSRVVALVAKHCPVAMTECLKGEVDGYLIKTMKPSVLVKALALIIEGERVYPANLLAWLLRGSGAPMMIVPQQQENHNLTDREVDILQLLVSGEPNKIIARHLSITEATVKVHLRSLLKKINAANRTQAAIWALHHGIARGSGPGAGVRPGARGNQANRLRATGTGGPPTEADPAVARIGGLGALR